MTICGNNINKELKLSGYPDTAGYCAELISPGLEVIVLKCHQENNNPCHHQVSSANWNPPTNLALFSGQTGAAYKYEVAFTVLGVISLIFLLLTFYVYISLPDLYNLHGKIVLSNVVSVFLVTLYLIIVFNIIPSKSIFCLVLGYLVKASCLNLTEFIFPKELLNNSINISFCSHSGILYQHCYVLLDDCFLFWVSNK